MKKQLQNTELFSQGSETPQQQPSQQQPSQQQSPQQQPEILRVNVVARSHLFTVESVDLRFSNGVESVYERMRPVHPEAVLIVPVIGDQLLLVKEYAVGLEAYQLGFPKGSVDPGETAFEAANRELKEEAGFGAKHLEMLSQLTTAPSWFSGIMKIVLADELYPEKLEGDEPEPLQVISWPLKNMMDLLNEPDFQEARNVSALFLAREWLVKQGRISY